MARTVGLIIEDKPAKKEPAKKEPKQKKKAE